MAVTANDSFKGVARISRHAFREELHRAASGVTAERDNAEYWDAIWQYGVDPLLLLAMFEHESNMGKAGVAQQTHSWGNTRKPTFGAVSLRETGGASGTFSTYATWLDGCVSTTARLVAHVYRGRTTIREIFDHPSGQVWAPAGDFNNPSAYLRSVIDFMNAHADTEIQQHFVSKPGMRCDRRSAHQDGYGTPRIVEAICEHIADGSAEGSLSWFENPVSGASSNYLIRIDGTIHEVVNPDHSAWTNGQLREPDLSNPLIARWVAAGLNPNTRTLSIEHEGRPSDSLTPAQLGATIDLAAWLCQEYALPADRTHIIGHYQIDKVQRAYCPSFSDAEWTAIVHGTADKLARSAPVPADDRILVTSNPYGDFGYRLGFRARLEAIGRAIAPNDVNAGILSVVGWPREDEYADIEGGSTQRTERAVLKWAPNTAPPFDIVIMHRGSKIPKRKDEP